jgi:hypothetical protein
MQCAHCHAEVGENAQFCPNCGQFIVREAPARFDYAAPNAMKVPALPVPQPEWISLLIFALAGFLVCFLAFSPIYLGSLFGISMGKYTLSIILLGLVIGVLFLTLPLSKGKNGKLRFGVGVGLALLGLVLNFIGWSVIPYGIARLLILASLPFILSFLGHIDRPNFWIYLGGGAVGASITIAFMTLLLRRVGFSQVGLFLTVIGALLALVPLIFARNEMPPARSFSAARMAALFGVCLLLFTVATFLQAL